MLDRSDAETLVRVAGGSPIGELLRRYWMPIAAVAELDDKPILPVRVLGEDLILYRDRGGTYGLLERWCPHRRFDLAYGMIEDHGIRCSPQQPHHHSIVWIEAAYFSAASVARDLE